MSNPFRVHWAGVAEEDLKSIILYIAEDSPTNARTIFEKIKEKASSLTHFPERTHRTRTPRSGYISLSGAHCCTVENNLQNFRQESLHFVSIRFTAEC